MKIILKEDWVYKKSPDATATELIPAGTTIEITPDDAKANEGKIKFDIVTDNKKSDAGTGK